ncbi:MAG: protein-disulfide reductase DsbD [Betaproteobacteria bacterium]|nr:protein-disulfide reductase DsbD [Betaproteobacteria bacterium]
MRSFATLVALIALLAGSATACAAGPDNLLEPDKAFRISARALDAATLEVRYRIADGYYMYRERFRFAAEPAGVKLGPPQFPPGEVKDDPFFGRTETYRKDLRIRVPLDDAGGAQSIKLKATSQGCSDTGVCYVPQDQYVEISLAGADSSSSPGASPAPFMTSRSPSVDSSPGFSIFASDTDIKAMFESASFWVVLATFFGFGILLAFTPCMLPMVPILSGIIAGEGRDINKLRALILSLAYVAGMAVTYALAGVAAAYSGAMLAAALQNPWVLTVFAALFVWLALSMFGFHDIQLPGFMHHRLSRVHHKLQGGRIASVAAMGVLSALIMSPCVAAPLAGALLYIGQTRDVVLGGSALFVMALGMGLPLVAVGVSEGALLPKSGAWMGAVKNFFGVLLLGVAIWIISPVIPAALVMLLWAALFIVSGVFLRALDPLAHDASGYARLWKGFGLIALVAGVALVIGALAGSRDPLQPLAGLRAAASGSAPESPTPFERVSTSAELDARLASAGKPALLDFYADWCVSCKEMERYTFSDPRVRAKFADMLLLQADVTANSAEHKALLKRFRLFGPPGIIFFDKSGREIEGLRVIGYQDADRFLATLRQAQSF